ncbi:MAG: GAF domain-containing protein [Rhodobacterales bacterium]|nr:GAF domain-containing protein [Rhodobacterales bacterium]
MSDRVAEALAEAESQPMTALEALGRLSEQVTGAKLVTLMTSDAETGEAERVWSNMPDEYPVAGRKPLNETHWSRTVLGEHKTFVANTIEEIAEVFFDHEQIGSLGCGSVMNLPIIVGGTVLGTINCLDVAGYFTPERVTAADVLRVPGAAVYLYEKLHRMGAA